MATLSSIAALVSQNTPLVVDKQGIISSSDNLGPIGRVLHWLGLGSAGYYAIVKQIGVVTQGEFAKLQQSFLTKSVEAVIAKDSSGAMEKVRGMAKKAQEMAESKGVLKKSLSCEETIANIFDPTKTEKIVRKDFQNLISCLHGRQGILDAQQQILKDLQPRYSIVARGFSALLSKISSIWNGVFRKNQDSRLWDKAQTCGQFGLFTIYANKICKDHPTEIELLQIPSKDSAPQLRLTVGIAVSHFTIKVQEADKQIEGKFTVVIDAKGNKTISPDSLTLESSRMAALFACFTRELQREAECPLKEGEVATHIASCQTLDKWQGLIAKESRETIETMQEDFAHIRKIWKILKTKETPPFVPPAPSVFIRAADSLIAEEKSAFRKVVDAVKRKKGKKPDGAAAEQI